MKLGPVLLLNLVVVIGALLIYDQLRGDDPKPERTRTRVENDGSLEQRVGALEAARHEVVTETSAPEESTAGQAPVDGPAAPEELSPKESALRALGATPAAPSRLEIQRFRQLRAAVEREDRIERNRERVDGALDKLPFRLTTRQRERIHGAFADFEPRIDEIWTEAKEEARQTVAAGGKVDRQRIVTTVGEIIQKAFAETIAGVVDRPADAEIVAETLLPARK